MGWVGVADAHKMACHAIWPTARIYGLPQHFGNGIGRFLTPRWSRDPLRIQSMYACVLSSWLSSDKFSFVH